MSAVQVWEWVHGGPMSASSLERVCLDADASWFWVDVTDPDTEILEGLTCMNGVHPLTVEDVLHRQGRPKIDLFGDGVFVTWLTPVVAADGSVQSVELDVYLTSRMLVTFRGGSDEITSHAIATVRASAATDPAWLLHGILDLLVDYMIPIVESNSDRLDELEESLLLSVTPAQLVDLYSIRRDLVALRRLITPAKEVVRALARESEQTEHGSYWYFQDILDHLTSIQDSIETDREVAAAVMDIYLSSQSNKTNDIMRQLTVVATIFMPLTLITGIYGMNVVKGMWPPFDVGWSFTAVIAGMTVLSASMILYFRRKNWW